VTAESSQLLKDYQFGEAARAIQELFWDEFCDWYLEVAKIQLRDGASGASQAATRRTLVDVFERILRLLHPFAPFATEELWQAFAPPAADGSNGTATPGGFRRSALIVAEWPEAGAPDAEAEAAFGSLVEMVQGVRRLKTEYRVGSQLAPAVIDAGARAGLLRDHLPLIRTLARLNPIEVEESLGASPPRALSVVAGGVTVYLPVEGLFDVGQELVRTEKEHADAERTAERTATQLAQPTFAAKAPPQVVAQRREQLAEQRERAERLGARLATLRSLQG
jgi:valyl-tRNA synthetase